MHHCTGRLNWLYTSLSPFSLVGEMASLQRTNYITAGTWCVRCRLILLLGGFIIFFVCFFTVHNVIQVSSISCYLPAHRAQSEDCACLDAKASTCLTRASVAAI